MHACIPCHARRLQLLWLLALLAASTAQRRQLLALTLQPPSTPSTAAPTYTTQSGSPSQRATAPVSDGPSLVRALADPSITTITLQQDIKLEEVDWAAAPASPIIVARNLTVMTDPSRGMQPVLLNGSCALDKIQVQPGCWVVVERVALAGWQRPRGVIAFASDVFARSPEPASGQARAYIMTVNSYLFYPMCMSGALMRAGLSLIRRPPAYPGVQRIAAMPGERCTGMVMPAALGCAWRPDGCASVSSGVCGLDYAVEGVAVEGPGSLIFKKGYDSLGVNTSALCDARLSEQCIQEHGVMACLALTQGGAGAGEDGGAGDGGDEADAAAAAAAAQGTAGQQDGGGGDGRGAAAGAGGASAQAEQPQQRGDAGAPPATGAGAVRPAALSLPLPLPLPLGDASQAGQGRGQRGEQQAQGEGPPQSHAVPPAGAAEAGQGPAGAARGGEEGQQPQGASGGGAGGSAVPLHILLPVVLVGAAALALVLVLTAVGLRRAGRCGWGAVEAQQAKRRDEELATTTTTTATGASAGCSGGHNSSPPPGGPGPGPGLADPVQRQGTAAATPHEGPAALAGTYAPTACAAEAAAAAAARPSAPGGGAAPATAAEAPSGSSSGAPPPPPPAPLQRLRVEVVTPWSLPLPGVRLGLRWGVDVEAHPEALLGVGSYGRVVEGTMAGRRVALKLMRAAAGSATERSALRQSQQEVEVLSRCRHRNVVALLGACLTPPHVCLVMELMDHSLDHLIHGGQQQQQHAEEAGAGGLMPMDQVLRTATDIAQGLAYLHPTVVHRDLKPANVLLDAAGTAKLSDFGLSRLRTSVLPTQRPEAGTVPYMAPECFDTHNAHITHKADIYGFGVLLWEMIVGQRPWSGMHRLQVAMAVTVFGKRLPLGGLRKVRCPPRLHKLLADCWAADPAARPSAEEVVKRLALAGQQLAAQGEQWAASGERWDDEDGNGYCCDSDDDGAERPSAMYASALSGLPAGHQHGHQRDRPHHQPAVRPDAALLSITLLDSGPRGGQQQQQQQQDLAATAAAYAGPRGMVRAHEPMMMRLGP